MCGQGFRKFEALERNEVKTPNTGIKCNAKPLGK